MASTQSSVRYSNESFKEDLKTLSTGIVWKNLTLARELESDDTAELYRIELFITANRGLLNYNIIRAFPKVVLRNAGIPAESLNAYAADKRKIPESIRDTIVAEYQRALCSKNPRTGQYAYYDRRTDTWVTLYEENNNYYRMLMGLPNTDDHSYVYNTDPRWDTNTPIHEMELVDRYEMEREGVLDLIIAEHPDKEYLKHLGRKSIDFFTARVADRFDILWRNDSSTKTLDVDFDAVYDKCKQLVMAVYFNNAMRKTNGLYENFLAMCILFMTLQQMQSFYLEADNTREFYDVESLKVVYDAYSVPFYNEVPLEYHRKIVKNINKLISYKGSAQAFFDLFQIFDLGSMDIYQYYMSKRHKVDAHGKPIYVFKTDETGEMVLDEKGRPIYDPSVYELKFSRVKFGEDPALSIADASHDVDYDVITKPDPYWVEDEQLQAKLRAEEFNYTETKYIGIQTIFDLMKITYENAYIFRMITDNRDTTEGLEFRWTDMGLTCSLFDLFIYVAALYCRLYGYQGLISDKIPAVMDTLGYNFEEALDILRNTVLGNEYLAQNQELIDLMQDMTMDSVDEANKVYDHIVRIRELIMHGYQYAKSKDEFFAYRDLYDALLVSKEVTAVYTNPRTGEVYETFIDVLADCSPDLLQHYLLIEDDDVTNEMNVAIDQLESVVTSMRWLPFSAGVNSSKMIESLFKILKFFKSAKAELLGYDITYTITLRGTNFFKMLDLIDQIATSENRDDKEYFIGLLELSKELMKQKSDLMRFLDHGSIESDKTYLRDYINQLTDMLNMIHDVIDLTFGSESWYIDFVKSVASTTYLKCGHLMKDMMKAEEITWDIYEPKYHDMIRDEIRYLIDSWKSNQYCSYAMSYLYLIDILQNMTTTVLLSKETGAKMEDRRRSESTKTWIHSDYQLVEEVFKQSKELYYAADQLRMIDELQGSYSFKGSSNMSLEDRVAKILACYQVNDQLISLEDLLRLMIAVGYSNDTHIITDELYRMAVSSELQSTDTWYLDFIQSIQNSVSHYVDGFVFNDHMKAEEILYDIIDPRYTDLIKDKTAKYADQIKKSEAGSLQVMEILHLLDDIHTQRVTINLRNQIFMSRGLYEDLAKPHTESNHLDQFTFQEVIQALIQSGKSSEYHVMTDDLLMGMLDSNMDDEQMLRDSLNRLIALYYVTDQGDLTDLLKDIMNLAIVNDPHAYVDSILARLNASSNDDIALIDILHSSSSSSSVISDLQMMGDMMKAELILYEEFYMQYHDEVHDQISALVDSFKDVTPDELGRIKVVDTMVLVNGLSKILSVSTQWFGDGVQDNFIFVEHFKENGEPHYSSEDTHTFQDVINIMTQRESISEISTFFDELMTTSQDQFKSIDALTDRLCTLIARMNVLSDEVTIQDLLSFLALYGSSTDRQGFVDQWYSYVSSRLSDSDQLSLDFIGSIENLGHVYSLNLWKDKEVAEETFFDLFDITYTDTIKDRIEFLTDFFRISSRSDAIMAWWRDLMNLADDIHSARVSVNFGKIFIEVNAQKDQLKRIETLFNLNESHTFSDVIQSIEMKYRDTESIRMYDSLSTSYQNSAYDHDMLQDHLQTICALAELKNDPNVILDTLQIIAAFMSGKDISTLSDRITQQYSENIEEGILSTDILDSASVRSHIFSLNLFNDMNSLEEIFFDIFESRYKGTVKDQLQYLTDRYGSIPSSYDCYRIWFVETLAIADYCHRHHTAIDIHNPLFNQILTITDSVRSINDQTVLHSQSLMQEVLSHIDSDYASYDIQQLIERLVNVNAYQANDMMDIEDRIARILAICKVANDTQYLNDLIRALITIHRPEEAQQMVEDMYERVAANSEFSVLESSDFLKSTSDVANISFASDDIERSILYLYDLLDISSMNRIKDHVAYYTDLFGTNRTFVLYWIRLKDTLQMFDDIRNQRIHIRINDRILHLDDSLISSNESIALVNDQIQPIDTIVAIIYRRFVKDALSFTESLLQIHSGKIEESNSMNDRLYRALLRYHRMQELYEMNDALVSTHDVIGGKSDQLIADSIMTHYHYTNHDNHQFVELLTRLHQEYQMILESLDQNDKFVQSYLYQNHLDRQNYQDILSGYYQEKVSDNEVNEDQLTNQSMNYGIESEIGSISDFLRSIANFAGVKDGFSMLDILFGQYHTWATDQMVLEGYVYDVHTAHNIEYDTESIQDQLYRVIALHTIIEQMTMHDQLSGQSIDYAQDVHSLQDLAKGLILKYRLINEISLLRDMLSKIHDSYTIKELSVCIDTISTELSGADSDTHRIQDMIHQIQTEMHLESDSDSMSDELVNLSDIMKSNDAQLMKDLLSQIEITNLSDFDIFMDRYVRSMTNYMIHDSADMVNKLIHTASSRNIRDIHQLLDDAFGAYSTGVDEDGLILDEYHSSNTTETGLDHSPMSDEINMISSIAYQDDESTYHDRAMTSMEASMTDQNQNHDNLHLSLYSLNKKDLGQNEDQLNSSMYQSLVKELHSYVDRIVGAYISLATDLMEMNDRPTEVSDIVNAMECLTSMDDIRDYLNQWAFADMLQNLDRVTGSYQDQATDRQGLSDSMMSESLSLDTVSDQSIVSDNISASSSSMNQHDSSIQSDNLSGSYSDYVNDDNGVHDAIKGESISLNRVDNMDSYDSIKTESTIISHDDHSSMNDDIYESFTNAENDSHTMSDNMRNDHTIIGIKNHYTLRDLVYEMLHTYKDTDTLDMSDILTSSFHGKVLDMQELRDRFNSISDSSKLKNDQAIDMDSLVRSIEQRVVKDLHHYVDEIFTQYCGYIMDRMIAHDVLFNGHSVYDTIRDHLAQSDGIQELVQAHITETELFLDRIIGNYSGVMTEFQSLQDASMMIHLNQRLADIQTHTEKLSHSYVRMIHSDISTPSDQLQVGQNINFMNDLQSYLDRLNGIITWYNSEHSAMTDRAMLIHSEGSVNDQSLVSESITQTQSITKPQDSNIQSESIMISSTDTLKESDVSEDILNHLNSIRSDTEQSISNDKAILTQDYQSSKDVILPEDDIYQSFINRLQDMESLRDSAILLRILYRQSDESSISDYIKSRIDQGSSSDTMNSADQVTDISTNQTDDNMDIDDSIVRYHLIHTIQYELESASDRISIMTDSQKMKETSRMIDNLRWSYRGEAMDTMSINDLLVIERLTYNIQRGVMRITDSLSELSHLKETDQSIYTDIGKFGLDISHSSDSIDIGESVSISSNTSANDTSQFGETYQSTANQMSDHDSSEFDDRLSQTTHSSDFDTAHQQDSYRSTLESISSDIQSINDLMKFMLRLSFGYDTAAMLDKLKGFYSGAIINQALYVDSPIMQTILCEIIDDQSTMRDVLMRQFYLASSRDILGQVDMMQDQYSAFVKDMSVAQDTMIQAHIAYESMNSNEELHDQLTETQEVRSAQDTQNSEDELSYSDELMMREHSDFIDRIMNLIDQVRMYDLINCFTDNIINQSWNLTAADLNVIIDHIMNTHSSQVIDSSSGVYEDCLKAIQISLRFKTQVAVQYLLENFKETGWTSEIQSILRIYYDALQSSSASIYDVRILFENIRKYDELYEEAYRLMTKNTNVLNDRLQAEIPGTILVRDTKEYQDILKWYQSHTSISEDHSVQDHFTMSMNGTFHIIQNLSDQIQMIINQCAVFVMMQECADCVMSILQNTISEDTLQAVEKFSILQQEYPDVIEESIMYADIPHHSNTQIIICNPLHMRDGLYEQTSSGYRLVV